MTVIDDRQGAHARKRLAAQVRAVENPRLARIQPDGSIHILSETDASVSYRVEFFGVSAGEGYVTRFRCSCPAGVQGVHCKHAARAGLRLEREGLVTYSTEEGEWFVTDKSRSLGSAVRSLAQSQPE